MPHFYRASRARGAAVLLAAALIAAACSDDEPTQPGTPGADVTVEVRDNSYVPDTARIATGGTVQWEWLGNNHTVTSVLTPSFVGVDTVQNALSKHGPVTFATAGTYRYVCTTHGGLSADSTMVVGMSGVVLVQ